MPCSNRAGGEEYDHSTRGPAGRRPLFAEHWQTNASQAAPPDLAAHRRMIEKEASASCPEVTAAPPENATPAGLPA